MPRAARSAASSRIISTRFPALNYLYIFIPLFMMDKYSDMSLVSVHTIFKDYVQGSSSKCVSHEGWGGGGGPRALPSSTF